MAWATCQWRADWACINCLPHQWGQDYHKVIRWIATNREPWRGGPGGKGKGAGRTHRTEENDRSRLHLRATTRSQEQHVAHRQSLAGQGARRRPNSETRNSGDGTTEEQRQDQRLDRQRQHQRARKGGRRGG